MSSAVSSNALASRAGLVCFVMGDLLQNVLLQGARDLLRIRGQPIR
jgi:hypothetical protein